MSTSGLGRRAVLVLGAGLLAGCGLWPFGGNRSPASAPGIRGTAAQDPAEAAGTELLPVVRLAAAERGRQGVILRVEGVAARQGYHSPVLVTAGRSADGIETVELRARRPHGALPVGPERTRVLIAGRFYSNREMEAIRGFRVVAAQNSATALP